MQKELSAQDYGKSHLEVGKRLQLLRDNVSSVIHGKPDVIDHAILALISGESILIEDVPGVGKTTLAKALAASVHLEFQRVQCTPDLLPADIFGFSIFNPQDSTFKFRPGPIFCNILLVDEINRASPRTQSALLEAMAERQVTIEGTRHELSPPFLVIATQNPSGSQGTFPLPESQLDRFLLQISIDYPSSHHEVDILFNQALANPVDDLAAVLTSDELIEVQARVRQVKVERTVAEYMVKIVSETRTEDRLQLGCSPRGSLLLFRASQARAMLSGRDYVLPDDVQSIAPFVLAHRVVMHRSQRQNHLAAREIIREIIDGVRVPV
jgi:MoxR-like ATPase